MLSALKASGKRHIALCTRDGAPLPRREETLYVDTQNPFGDLACVIMASGLGRRFGANKLTADFCGQPMILRALDATEGIFKTRVVVTRHQDVAALCQARGVQVILHDLPGRNDTVRLGIKAALERRGCMFLPGDQPLLRRETVAAMALCAADEEEFIWRAAHDGAPGSPAIFPRWAFEELRCLPEGKGGSAVIARHPQRVRLFEVEDAREMMDADTREALDRLCGMAQEMAGSGA